MDTYKPTKIKEQRQQRWDFSKESEETLGTIKKAIIWIEMNANPLA